MSIEHAEEINLHIDTENKNPDMWKLLNLMSKKIEKTNQNREALWWEQIKITEFYWELNTQQTKECCEVLNTGLSLNNLVG